MSRTATMTSSFSPRSAATGAALAHGVKRPADDTLDDEHRFAKRFNLLNIDGHATGGRSKLYIPVDSHVAPQTQPSLHPSQPGPGPAAISGERENGQRVPAEEGMQIDDTPNRVYIHDLDSELASIPDHPSKEKLIFLPDIDRALSSIPQHILRPDRRNNDDGNNGRGKELVLYSTPSVEGGDVVGRAMDETRRRQIEDWKGRSRGGQAFEGETGERAHGFGGEEYGLPDAVGHEGLMNGRDEDGEEDPDAMDIG